MNSALRDLILGSSSAAAAAFTPASLTGLALWLKADAGTTLDGSNNLTDWADQSGNGNHATQATVNLRPNLVANLVGSLPGVRFDGTDDCMTGTTLLASDSDFTIMSVVRKEGPAGDINGGCAYFIIGTDKSFGPSVGLFNAVNKGGWLNGGVAWNTGSATDLSSGNVFRQTLRRTGGVTYYSLAPLSHTANATESPAATPYGVYRLGRHSTASAVKQPLSILEIVFCTASLSTDEQNSFATYSLARWGV